jgi:type IV secretory pathway VirB10-like protein
MRGARREDDTIEMYFSEAQKQELAALAAQTETLPAEAVAAPRRVRRHSPWTTVAVAATLSAISSGITYVAATRAEANRAAEPQTYSAALVPSPTPHLSLPGEVPVKFVNPFDASEIFEFPAGTSQTGARDAVAEALLKRARDRLAGAEVRLRTREMAERERVERAMTLAEAG